MVGRERERECAKNPNAVTLTLSRIVSSSAFVVQDMLLSGHCLLLSFFLPLPASWQHGPVGMPALSRHQKISARCMGLIPISTRFSKQRRILLHNDACPQAQSRSPFRYLAAYLPNIIQRPRREGRAGRDSTSRQRGDFEQSPLRSGLSRSQGLALGTNMDRPMWSETTVRSASLPGPGDYIPSPVIRCPQCLTRCFLLRFPRGFLPFHRRSQEKENYSHEGRSAHRGSRDGPRRRRCRWLHALRPSQWYRWLQALRPERMVGHPVPPLT